MGLSELKKEWRVTPMSQRVLLLLALFVLGLLCVYPFSILIYHILFSGEGHTLTLRHFESVLRSPTTLRAAGNTILLSLSVAGLSLGLAVPLGWVLSRTDLKFSKQWRSWLCLPYAIPPYIGAIAWIFLANPTTGLLNQFIGHKFLNIYSFFGLVWVETSFMYTFVLLTTLTSLDRMDSSLEEAARLSGASPLRVLKDIILPLIRPSLFSGALLAMLATVASFGVPALIGSPARLYFLTTQIYTLQKMGTFRGMLGAGALSVMLLVVALGVLLLSQWVVKKYSFPIIGGKTARPSAVALGRWQIPVQMIVGLLFTLVFVLPIGGILISALSRIQGSLGLQNLTFENIRRTLFEVGETPRAFGNSFFLGTLAATIATSVGVLLSYLQTKTKVPARGLVEVVASFPYSTPGSVVAFAIILTVASGFFGLGPILYGTSGVLIFAYVVKYLSFAIRTTSDGFSQIDNSLAEAARVSGASWIQTMTTVWLPLIRPSMVAAWFLIFMPVMSELTMTLMLAGPGQETLGTLIFQLQEYSDASGGGASVLALFVVFSILLINFILKQVSKGKYGL